MKERLRESNLPIPNWWRLTEHAPWKIANLSSVLASNGSGFFRKRPLNRPIASLTVSKFVFQWDWREVDSHQESSSSFSLFCFALGFEHD